LYSFLGTHPGFRELLFQVSEFPPTAAAATVAAAASAAADIGVVELFPPLSLLPHPLQFQFHHFLFYFFCGKLCATCLFVEFADSEFRRQTKKFLAEK
jgi:hypothetical protein